MHYIIMDLEWNYAYAHKLKGFINEIIEIGAVKLNEELEIVDTFSSFIKVQIGKKLKGKVKRITNITAQDLESGKPFTQALAEFRHWVGEGDCLTFTWVDGDIRVLFDNYKYLNGISFIPFLKKYADLQAFFHKAHKLPTTTQIGLSTAAEKLEIDVSAFDIHRALGDSLLSAEIFSKSFDAELLEELTLDCDQKFYDRLSFKAYIISRLDDPDIKSEAMYCVCKICKIRAEQVDEWAYKNKYFHSEFHCKECGTDYEVRIRFKKHFDKVTVHKRYRTKVAPDESAQDDALASREVGEAPEAPANI